MVEGGEGEGERERERERERESLIGDAMWVGGFSLTSVTMT